MAILVATGHLAEQTVRDSVGSKADVIVVDTDVAAFITPRRLIEALRKQEVSSKYEIIFIPGLVSSNFSSVEKELGCKIYLGTKHAYDLGYMLSFLGKVDFSSSISACELLSDVRRDIALKTIQKIENAAVTLMNLGNLKLGGFSRMKVMAEIVDATGMDPTTLKEKIRTFTKKGADIIDLGASLNATPDDVEQAIRTAREVSNVPISIDTLDDSLIKKAVDVGVDIVLSLNSSNIWKIGTDVARSGAAAVVIPNTGEGFESLIQNIKAAKNVGITRIIADPVLDPIGHGITKSIVRYQKFHEDFPHIPIFFGVGNVTELIDADSIGVNAALCGIASDVCASILFTPEYSDKTQGSIYELKIASEMMVLSKVRKSSPKDLGIDLLVLKEKRRRIDMIIPENAVTAREAQMWRLDPAGCIRIGIVSDANSSIGGVIVADHKKASIVGESAHSILDTLIEMGLVSTVGHAGYLGRELKKAELALKYNRSYSQDDYF
ncbi:MAG: dihydropteroate synthase-like protein [Methanosarcinaceae archaeon]|nr:dihydropteroate synthase-like protein [Methanosarcinaceae archaeon]